jgi:GNAT superfamily N-acetyltransferase
VIRAATEADYEAYARLCPELGVDDPLASRELFKAELLPRMIVATDGYAVVGYALSDQLADTGYVRSVVTDPGLRRRGVGVALMEALRAAFVAAGETAWRLNVRPDNEPAIRLWQRCGMVEAYRACVLRVPATALLEPLPDMALAPLVAADYAELEPRFGLPRGQLAHARPARAAASSSRCAATRSWASASSHPRSQVRFHSS